MILRSEKERKIRALIKTVSWRTTGALLTLGTAWILTKDLSLALSIFTIREIVAIILYYGHERIWNSIKWGKYRAEKLDPNYVPHSDRLPKRDFDSLNSP